MPNDYPFLTDFSAPSASGDSPSARRSLRRLAPYALAIGAVGLAVASRYRARYSFANKVVLITGGSRGLGLVLARELASRGALLALLARDGIGLARARRTICSDSMVQLLPADVTHPAQVEHAFSTTVRRFGRIDAVINAEPILSAPFDDTSPEEFLAMLDVHFWGTLNVNRAALPHLARHGDGRIINIGAISGRIPAPHLSAYRASKYAQAGLSDVTEELRSKGIRVTLVMPGTTSASSVSAERAAQSILDASARGKADVIIPFSLWQVAKLSAVIPNAWSRSSECARTR